ncbi:MAG TPA: hypothetical protein VHY82_03665, partial [Acetobacteraceae bacterium]|nr:hypothetical protein [Acetobacteraceae bacterium]
NMHAVSVGQISSRGFEQRRRKHDGSADLAEGREILVVGDVIAEIGSLHPLMGACVTGPLSRIGRGRLLTTLGN